MRIKVEKQKKDTRLEKKRKMEGHWEMLRWIVTFMGENETKWKEMKMEKERERRKKEAEEQWLLKNREERIRELAEIEEQQKAEAKNNKEARYREAVRLKRSWREWRVGEDGEEDDCVEVEEDLPLGKTEELCLICVVMPCVCPLVKLERRLELLRLKEKIRDLEEKKQKADEKVHEHDKTKQIKKNRAEHQLQDKILTKNKTTEIFPNNRADQSALHPPSPPQHPRSPSEDTSQLHHQQYQEHLSQSPITSQTSLSPPLYQYPPTSLEEPENLISKEKHPPIHLGPPPLSSSPPRPQESPHLTHVQPQPSVSLPLSTPPPKSGLLSLSPHKLNSTKEITPLESRKTLPTSPSKSSPARSRPLGHYHTPPLSLLLHGYLGYEPKVEHEIYFKEEHRNYSRPSPSSLESPRAACPPSSPPRPSRTPERQGSSPPSTQQPRAFSQRDSGQTAYKPKNDEINKNPDRSKNSPAVQSAPCPPQLACPPSPPSRPPRTPGKQRSSPPSTEQPRASSQRDSGQPAYTSEINEIKKNPARLKDSPTAQPAPCPPHRACPPPPPSRPPRTPGRQRSSPPSKYQPRVSCQNDPGQLACLTEQDRNKKNPARSKNPPANQLASFPPQFTPCPPAQAQEQHQPWQNQEEKSERLSKWSTALNAALNCESIQNKYSTYSKSKDDNNSATTASSRGQRGCSPSPSKVGVEVKNKQTGAELSASSTMILKTEGGHGTSLSKTNSTVATLAAKPTTTTTRDTEKITTIKQQIAKFNKLGGEQQQQQRRETPSNKTTTITGGIKKKITRKQQPKTTESEEKQHNIVKLFKKMERKQQEETEGSRTTTMPKKNENTTTTTEANQEIQTNNAEAEKQQTNLDTEEARKSTSFTGENKQQQQTTRKQQQQQPSMKKQLQQQTRKPVNNKRKKQQDEENPQQYKITKYMKQSEQQQTDETTTTTTTDCKQQQQQNVRQPTKLMVKTKGIEITDMKEFLAKKRRKRAALFGNENFKSNLAELHTQQKNVKSSARRGLMGKLDEMNQMQWVVALPMGIS